MGYLGQEETVLVARITPKFTDPRNRLLMYVRGDQIRGLEHQYHWCLLQGHKPDGLNLRTEMVSNRHTESYSMIYRGL